jgi:hypothetical protein
MFMWECEERSFSFKNAQERDTVSYFFICKLKLIFLLFNTDWEVSDYYWKGVEANLNMINNIMKIQSNYNGFISIEKEE